MKKLFLITFFSFAPLYAFALTENISLSISSNSSTTSQVEATSTTSSKPFTVCSQEAIERRDTSIAASRSTYNNAMTLALNERKNREKAAVAMIEAEEKKVAIKLSVDTYKQQVKAAQNTLTDARKAAWSTFEADIKACREEEGEEAAPQAATMKESSVAAKASLRKVEEDKENKSLRETIKAQIETIISIFNSN